MSRARPTVDYDVVVVGSGVAGLSVAAGLAADRRVAVVTSGELGGGSTRWAQGGIAAAVGDGDDSRLHAADTMAAGAGLSDPDAVGRLTDDAPARLADLLDAGADFDRAGDGRLALSREGGHRCRRVAHAGGDATGAEVSRALVAALRRTTVDVLEATTVLDLLLGSGRAGPQVTGLVARRGGGSPAGDVITARAVVLATGGIGGLYEASTNPPEVGGDGLALALRAGASLVDLEFVQFHPTGLRVVAAGQIPLISEALRGEGAVLRDAAGQRVMAGRHPMADLAPRDIVARRIDEVMAERVGGAANHVVLDATGMGREALRVGFPTAYDACRRHGIDPAEQPIPIVPAQHFLCGGIRTDVWGATDVDGLLAVGEVAATGVHGANRLASNSLLEGLVFGRRIATRLSRELPSAASGGDVGTLLPRVAAAALPTIRATTTRYAGVRRSGAGLDAAAAALRGLIMPTGGTAAASHDAANRWTVAAAIIAAAAARQESRGCHWRADYQVADDRWRHRIAVRLDDGMPAAAAAERLDRSA